MSNLYIAEIQTGHSQIRMARSHLVLVFSFGNVPYCRFHFGMRKYAPFPAIFHITTCESSHLSLRRSCKITAYFATGFSSFLPSQPIRNPNSISGMPFGGLM